MTELAQVTFAVNLINPCAFFDPGYGIEANIDGQIIFLEKPEIGTGFAESVSAPGSSMKFSGAGFSGGPSAEFTLELASPDLGVTWEVVSLTSTNIATQAKCSCRACQYWIGNVSYISKPGNYTFTWNVGCINDLLCCSFTSRCPGCC